MTTNLGDQMETGKPARLPYPRLRMHIPGTWEITSADGRHGGIVCSQTPYRDIQTRLDYLNQKEPDGGWTYEYIPVQRQEAM